MSKRVHNVKGKLGQSRENRVPKYGKGHTPPGTESVAKPYPRRPRVAGRVKVNG